MAAAATAPAMTPPATALPIEDFFLSFIGIIERGEVELSHRAGIRRVVLQILRDGDLLGDVPFFCRLPSPFTARALTEVMLIRLDRPSLDQLLAARPALAQRFLYSLASRLDRMQQRLLQLAGGDLRRQLASLLLGETADAQPVVRLPQATLAQLLGATRPAVNRILKALEAEGLIRLGYRFMMASATAVRSGPTMSGGRPNGNGAPPRATNAAAHPACMAPHTSQS